MIKTFVIFFLLLGLGYYVFDYIRKEKGIGFEKVEGNYILQIRPDYFIDSNLKMNKDGTFVFKYCSIVMGNYEIISGVYNFKITSTVSSDKDCNLDESSTFNAFRGKFLSNKNSEGIIKLNNDNGDQFYLVPDNK